MIFYCMNVLYGCTVSYYLNDLSVVTYKIWRNLARQGSLPQTNYAYNIQSMLHNYGALKQLCDNPNAKIQTVLTKPSKLCII